MSAPLTATSELEAVNELLEVIGEAPINSLSVTGRADVAIARSILNREVRRLCARGWFWNTDPQVTLALDADSKIPVPTNALQIDPVDTSVDITVRGGFLWDRLNYTSTMTDPIKVTIVRALPFDDLIEPARAYVVARAALKYAKRVLGDETTVAYTADDVLEALTDIEKAEDAAADHSLYQDPATMRVIGRFRSSEAWG